MIYPFKILDSEQKHNSMYNLKNESDSTFVVYVVYTLSKRLEPRLSNCLGMFVSHLQFDTQLHATYFSSQLLGRMLHW